MTTIHMRRHGRLTPLRRYEAGVLLGSGIFLCLNLFSLSGTPFLLGGDEQVFWMNAQRLLHGELIYRDFFEFTPPGTDLVYLSAFGLLGSRIWVPNVVVLVLGIALCWLCFHISRFVMKPAQAAVAAALFLVLDYGAWLDATHHWFSLLAVMGALAVLPKARSPARILISGALLGLASFFTQTRGVSAALGVAGFLLWDRFQTQEPWRNCLERQLQLLLSFVVTWGILSSYFIVKVGIWKLLYFQTSYVMRYVTGEWDELHRAELNVHAWPDHHVLVYVAVPLICAISLRRWRKASQETSVVAGKRVVLLAFVGLAMYAEMAQKPGWLRVDAVAMPSIVLAAWLMAGLAKRLRNYATTMIWIGLIGLSVHRIWYRNDLRSMVEDLPAGRIAATHLAGEKLAWIARHTTPGQFFFQASYQSVYLPLALRIPVFTFLDRQTRPDFVELDMRQLEAKRVQYILWSPLDLPRFPEFERYLAYQYQRVWKFPDQDEIWERK